jgi:hypothetical protein
MGRFCAFVILLLTGLGCGANMEAAVRGAATAHLALQDQEAGCDEWELYQLTPDDIGEDRRSLLDERLSKAEQRRLAERGVLFVATGPAWLCDPIAFVACVDGPESCLGLIDNFLPVTCSPAFY